MKRPEGGSGRKGVSKSNNDCETGHDSVLGEEHRELTAIEGLWKTENIEIKEFYDGK